MQAIIKMELYFPVKYSKDNSEFTEHYDFDYNYRYVIENETTAGMNFDREPRFYASVGFDRGVWYGNSYSDPAGDQGTTQAAYRYPKNRFGEFSSVWNSIGIMLPVIGRRSWLLYALILREAIMCLIILFLSRICVMQTYC